MLRICALAAAAATLTLACTDEEPPEELSAKTVAEVAVTVLNIEPREYRRYGTFIGELRGIEEATLIAYKGGRVSKLLSERGRRVKKGDRLCDIDGEQAELLRKAARLNEKLTHETFRRTGAHVSRGTSSRLKKERDELAWLQAKEAALQAQKAWRGAVCLAPFDGLVTQRFIQRFDDLAPAAPTFHVAATYKMRLAVEVPAGELSGYTPGAEAFLTLEEGGREWTGKIVSVGRRVDDRRRTVTMELEFANPHDELIPGASARARVLRQTAQDTVLIPTRAIQIQSGQPIVMVATGEEAQEREVELGPKIEGETLIRTGLKRGDRVIIKGADLVAENQKIRIIEEPDS